MNLSLRVRAEEWPPGDLNRACELEEGRKAVWFLPETRMISKPFLHGRPQSSRWMLTHSEVRQVARSFCRLLPLLAPSCLSAMSAVTVNIEGRADYPRTPRNRRR